MRLADSYIDAQEGALLAQDAIAEWLDRYRLELDSQTEQVIYEGILDSLKRADLIQRK
jgi:acyl carrier protein